MHTLKIFSLLFVMIIAISSCSLHKNGVATSHPFLNLQMQDMEYIKDVEDTTVQSYFLGVIPIGGKRYRKGHVNANVLTLTSFSNKRGMNNALYNILKKVPDADFVVPVYQYVQLDRMFLGRKEYIALRVKAFRLKSVSPDSINTNNPIDSIR